MLVGFSVLQEKKSIRFEERFLKITKSSFTY